MCSFQKIFNAFFLPARMLHKIQFSQRCERPLLAFSCEQLNFSSRIISKYCVELITHKENTIEINCGNLFSLKLSKQIIHFPHYHWFFTGFSLKLKIVCRFNRFLSCYRFTQILFTIFIVFIIFHFRFSMELPIGFYF